MRAAPLLLGALVLAAGSVAALPVEGWTAFLLRLPDTAMRLAGEQTEAKVAIGLGRADAAGVVFSPWAWMASFGECGEIHLVIEPTGEAAQATPLHGAGPIVRVEAWIETQYREEPLGRAWAVAWVPPLEVAADGSTWASGMVADHFILQDASTWCWCGWECAGGIEVRGWGLATICRDTHDLEVCKGELPDVDLLKET